MFDPCSKTLSFILLLSLGLPVLSSPVSEARKDPKTLYEAVQLRCPSIKDTEVETNLHDLFNSKCANWTENDQCLLLYESLVSFCTGMGDKLPKFKGLIPTKENVSLYDGDTVCFHKNPFGRLSKAEHNISKFASPTRCTVDCVGDTKTTAISDLCQFSYYFASFNGSRLLEQYNKMLAQKHGPEQGNEVAQASAANSSTNNQQATVSQKPETEVAVNSTSAKQPEKVESAQEVAPPLAGSIQAPSGSNEKKNTSSISSDVKGTTTSGAKVESTPAPVAKKNEEENVAVEGDEEKKGDQVNGDGQDDYRNKNDDDEPEEDGAGRADVMQAMPKDMEITSTSSKKAKPITVDPEAAASNFNVPEEDMDGDSYFFSYFTVIMCLVIVGYVGYHNRQKILALVLEGKRSKRPGRQGRRPNSANYHKLDSNLEEAMSSSCTRNASNVIY